MNLSQSTILSILLGFEVDLHLITYQITYRLLVKIEYFGNKLGIIMISVLCPEIHPMVLEYDIFGGFSLLWPININSTFPVGFKLYVYSFTQIFGHQHAPKAAWTCPKITFFVSFPSLEVGLHSIRDQLFLLNRI